MISAKTTLAMIRCCHRLIVGLFLLSPLGLLSLSAEVVEIADPALEQVVRSHLGKSTGEITTAEMESLLVLNISGGSRPLDTQFGYWPSPITTLQGLETAINLKSLDLSDRPMDYYDPGCFLNLAPDLDLSPLHSLSQLERLDLWGSGIKLSDSSLPNGLRSLRWLDLSGCSLEGLRLPSDLPNLETLIMARSGLTALVIPRSLQSLKSLDLSGNDLTGTTLRIPGQVSNLRELVLDSNRFGDSGFFAEFATLKKLSLANNGITEFKIPNSLRNLSSLNLEQNLLSEFSPMFEMPWLVELNLSGNQFSDFPLPPTLRAIRVLDLSYNQITQVQLPHDLNQLFELDLTGNLLEFLELPPGLSGLRRLHLGWNLLSGFQLPESANQLSRLDLLGNPGLEKALTLPGHWLEVPSSITSLWVRFSGYDPIGCGHGHGGCGGRYHLEYFGKFRISGLELGDNTVTIHFRNSEGVANFNVERSTDLINWIQANDNLIDQDARPIQIAHSGAETEFYRLRPIPASEEGWTYWRPPSYIGCPEE